MPTAIEVPAPGCICGQCTVPLYVGPVVERLLARYMTRISGVN